MVDIYTEGKVKPAIVGDKVADVSDLDGSLVTSVTRDTAGEVTVSSVDNNNLPQTLVIPSRSAGIFVAPQQGTVRVSGQVFVWTIQVQPADLEIMLGDTFIFHLPIAESTSAGRIDLEVNGNHRLPLQDASGSSVPERQLSDIGGIWLEAVYTGNEYLLSLASNAFDRTRQQLDVNDLQDNDIVLIANASDSGRVWRARLDHLAEALAGKMSPEDFRDAIRYGLVVVDDRNPTESDFANHRIFFDGIVPRKVLRTPVPGHDRIVAFREDNLQISQYGTGIYVDRNAANTVAGTPNVGDRYFNRSLNHWEIWEAGNYWLTSQFVAAPRDAQGSLWIGEFGNEDLADARVDRVGQIASYPDDGGNYVLHRVDSITAQAEDGFRYELEPLFFAHELANAEIDNAESDVQGTISGRGLARAVDEHSPFTDVERDILEDLSRQTFPHPTDDWQIRQTYVAHDFFTDRYATFLSLGWDADNRLRALSADGHVGRLGRHDLGRVYDGSERLRAGLISGVHWLYLRDEGVGSAIVRSPVDGGDSDPEFSIVLRYFSMFADPDSGTLLGILRRISSTEMEVGLLAYDAVAGTITAEDTITLDRAHLDAALGSDYAPLPDIHRESATGVYQEVSGAILEGDTLYLMLTDIAKTDGHTASVLVGFTLAGTPNNRTLTVLAENAVDELPVSSELTSGILPLEADELFLARDTAVYRLSPDIESETPALTNEQIDDPESDAQGTISGRGLERAVEEYSPFTDVEQDILEDLSRQVFPHPDDHWRIRQTYHITDFFADRYEQFLSMAWDADSRLRAMSRNGYVGRIGGHDQSRAYDGSDQLRAALISGTHWLYLRDHLAGSRVRRLPVGGGTTNTLLTSGSRYFNIFADPDSGTLVGLLRRISDAQIEVGFLAYDDTAGSLTPEDSIDIDRTTLDAALGSEYAVINDIHEERTNGEIRGVTCAILEGDTLYLLLTDLLTRSGGAASVLIGYTLGGNVGARTLTILAENPVLELPIVDGVRSGILPLEGDSLYLSTDYSAYRLSTQSESNKADTDLGNVDSDLTNEEQAALQTKLGLVKSDDDPAAVGETAIPGDDDELARKDHAHPLPTDDTLEFDPVSGDLGVSIHDVIQHLQESIRYYTDSIDHPTDPGGHSAGQMYRTGPFPTTISRVQSQIDVLFGHPSYAARIYRVDSDRNIEEFLGESSHFVPLSNNPHSYDFSGDDGIGIPIPANSFIDILFHAVGGVLIPLRTGDEASDSPGKSYQDANRDFNMLHSVVYEHVHPSVGDSTVSHGDNDHIRGNIKIFYEIAYDHGNLLGGAKADLDLQNIAEDLTDAEQQAVRTRIGAAELSAATARVAGVLDITDSEDWVETANYTDTTDLVGVDRNARFMSWLDGNLYLADTSGNINSRDVSTVTLTGMARGPDFFVLLDANAHTTRSAADLSLLGTSALGGRHAVAVQQNNHLRFWTLDLLSNSTISVRRFGVSADGRTISGQTAISSITIAGVNAALGADYITISGLYDESSHAGIIDLHVVSDDEFWVLFAGIPLTSDNSQTRTLMMQIVRPEGSNDFSFTGVNEVLMRDDGRSFVRIGDGLVYLGYGSGGSVARYEKRSARAQVYRDHQQDQLRRITSVERTAGTEDGIVEMSPADVRAIADAAIVSQTAQGVLVGNHTQLILWQYYQTQPPDPPNPYNSTTGLFRSSFNDWHMDEASALSARPDASNPLWIAYGGTDHVAPNDIQNRNWSIFAVAAQQYSADRGSTWHYPMVAGDNAYRYLLPTGQIWSPALQLADDPLGYIDLITDALAYSDHDNSNRYHALASAFDATNFSEMRIIARSFGSFDSNDNPSRFGAIGEVVITRKGGIWSDMNQTFERFLRNRSTLKLRLDDVQGLEVVEYGGGDTNDDLSANIHDASDFPERRVSMNMNINVATSAQNTIVGISFFNFPTIFAKCLVTVGVR